MATDTTPIGRCYVCGSTIITDEPCAGSEELPRHSGCTDDSFAALNRFYGLNVRVGQRVVADGSPGTVVGMAGGPMHLLVKLDGTAETPRPWHPTWNMEYVDG